MLVRLLKASGDGLPYEYQSESIVVERQTRSRPCINGRLREATRKPLNTLFLAADGMFISLKCTRGCRDLSREICRTIRSLDELAVSTCTNVRQRIRVDQSWNSM